MFADPWLGKAVEHGEEMPVALFPTSASLLAQKYLIKMCHFEMIPIYGGQVRPVLLLLAWRHKPDFLGIVEL
jgi:hypothetical protein